MINRLKLFKHILLKKNNYFKKYKKYPFCGREYCYCVRTLNLNNRNNYIMYLDCYRNYYN